MLAKMTKEISFFENSLHIEWQDCDQSREKDFTTAQDAEERGGGLGAG